MREGKEVVRDRAAWGPDPQVPAPVVVRVGGWDRSLLKQVGRLEDQVGVPVQAVRGDRVLSMEHVVVARWHAERALRGGRSRFQDPGVAFVCFLSARRQIAQAMQELGVPLDRPGEVPVLLVALGDVDPAGFMDAVRSVGLEPFPVAARSGGHDDNIGSAREIGDVMGRSARDHWDRRLGLDEDASGAKRRDRLLAKMALVSLEA